MKRTLLLLLSLFLVFASVATPAEAGKFKSPGQGGEPGTWFAGDTPPNLNPQYPVIVFVQGLNSSSHTWYGDNDMYEIAYNHGYQTAFVELHDSSGEARDMWANGSMLAGMLQEIYYHFGKPLVLVTHSKGGIDSQTALVHYGAHPYVTNVITLGSPHYGSQLADLAYSSWSWWIAAILGQRNEGTYSLQTGYMNWFRSETDHLPAVHYNSYYTLAGTSWGSFGSALYWGGLYLSQYGQNDGAVVVDYAFLPHGQMLRVDSWDHSEIATGSATFSWFQPYLTAHTLALSEANETYYDSEHSSPISENQPSDLVIRGGPHEGLATEHFFVEDGLEAITVDWMGDKELASLELIDPNGSTVPVSVSVAEDEYIFAGAMHHMLQIEDPEPGQWTIQAQRHAEDGEGAYLLKVAYESDLSQNLKMVPHQHKGQWELVVPEHVAKARDMRVNYRVDFIRDRNNNNKQQVQRLKEVHNQAGPRINIPMTGTGVYNITVDVQGKTAQGIPFERTIIRTIYRDDQGRLYVE